MAQSLPEQTIRKKEVLFFLIWVLLAAMSIKAFPQTGDENQVTTEIPQLPVADTAALHQLNWKDKMITTDFYDGQGRVFQKVNLHATPAGNNLVHAYKYDLAGRQTTDYLPFPAQPTKSNLVKDPLEQLKKYYHAPSEEVTPSDYPYTEKQFDNSPLNRVIQRGAPGESWQISQGHTKRAATSGNSKAITRWSIGKNGNCAIDGSYPENSLYVTKMTDENGNVTREYKDKLGQVVLKERMLDETPVQTFYVYDIKGNLSYVIPPMAAAEKQADPKYIYHYTYDKRNRMITKKIPGAETVCMVYDDLDRLVLSQNGNLRKDTLWLYTKYDVLGRTILTGLYKSIQSAGFLQKELDTLTFNVEERTGDKWTNKAFPTDNCRVLTQTFYDDYTFLTDTGYTYKEAGLYAGEEDKPRTEAPQPATNNRGRQTGRLIRVTGTGTWLL